MGPRPDSVFGEGGYSGGVKGAHTCSVGGPKDFNLGAYLLPSALGEPCPSQILGSASVSVCVSPFSEFTPTLSLSPWSSLRALWPVSSPSPGVCVRK